MLRRNERTVKPPKVKSLAYAKGSITIYDGRIANGVFKQAGIDGLVFWASGAKMTIIRNNETIMALIDNEKLSTLGAITEYHVRRYIEKNL